MENDPLPPGDAPMKNPPLSRETMTCPEPATALCRLCRGQSGVVEAFELSHPERCQLQEMGFHPGEMVTMLMPGNPCAIAVGSTRLMVQKELLEGILVNTLD